MELIRRFGDQAFVSALESWGFLDFAGLRALFASPFGDVFFEGNGGFWFLDLVGGELTRVCSRGDELTGLLNSREGRDQYLMAPLAAEADAAGVVPGPTEIYDFKVPPVLGGATEVANLKVLDFTVAVNIAGQIHGQVRTLPPGTPITGVQVS